MPGIKTITDLPAASTLIGDELVEVSQVSTTVTITAATISAIASDNSYNDSGSGFVTAGFVVGDRVRVTGFTGNIVNNIIVGVITALTTAKMTIGGALGDVIVDDAAGESVTISKWTSRRALLSEIGIGGGGGGGPIPVNTMATSYTLEIDDADSYIRMASAGSRTITVPPESDVDFPVGTTVQFRRAGGGSLTIEAGVGVVINTPSSYALRSTHSSAAIIKIGADEWDLTGDLEEA